MVCFIVLCTAEPYAAAQQSRNAWPQIDRWLVEYEAEVQNVLADHPPDERPYYVHKIVSAAAPDMFYHYLGHHFGGDSWQYEPRNQEAVFRDGIETHQRKFNRQLTVLPRPKGTDLPGTLPYETLFRVMPTWPLTDYQSPRDPGIGAIFVVHEALRSETYSGAAEHGTVNGEECIKYVSTNGSDTIWISRLKALCVLKREFRDPNSGRLLERIITGRTREIAKGLWLPTEFDSTFFLKSGSIIAPVAERIARCRVLDCRIGRDVPLDLFDPLIKPGSIENQPNGQFRQISAGGIDYLDEVVCHLRGAAALPTAGKRRFGLVCRLAWIGVGSAVGAVAGCILPRFNLAGIGAAADWRRARRRRRPCDVPGDVLRP